MLHRFMNALCGLALVAALVAAPAPAIAETSFDAARMGRQTLGFGHFFDNDVIGDGADRWQSGSYTMSWLRGVSWQGSLPRRPFEIVEYRLGGAIVAPARLAGPAAGDRRYVAKSQISMHSHFSPRHGTEAELGLGLVWTGPSNGLASLQRALHRIFSAPRPSAADTQLGNHLYPVLSGEFARPFGLGGAEWRPFLEARAGDETLLRLGLDLAFGGRERGALWLRDTVTGQRYVGIAGTAETVTGFVLGADIAHVFDSAYFPAADGVAFAPTRKRLRAGISTRNGAFGLFYGLAWLSEEFEGQPEGQVVGSLRGRVNF